MSRPARGSYSFQSKGTLWKMEPPSPASTIATRPRYATLCANAREEKLKDKFEDSDKDEGGYTLDEGL